MTQAQKITVKVPVIADYEPKWVGPDEIDDLNYELLHADYSKLSPGEKAIRKYLESSFRITTDEDELLNQAALLILKLGVEFVEANIQKISRTLRDHSSFETEAGRADHVRAIASSIANKTALVKAKALKTSGDYDLSETDREREGRQGFEARKSDRLERQREASESARLEAIQLAQRIAATSVQPKPRASSKDLYPYGISDDAFPEV